MKKKLDNHTIMFNFNGTPVEFTVDNNLAGQGLSIDNAVICWTARLQSIKDATVENFCQYAAGKSATLVCKPGVKGKQG